MTSWSPLHGLAPLTMTKITPSLSLWMHSPPVGRAFALFTFHFNLCLEFQEFPTQNPWATAHKGEQGTQTETK